MPTGAMSAVVRVSSGTAPRRRAGREPARRPHRVVAKHVGGVGHFLEGVPARLAGLELDQIEDFLLPREQVVVDVQQQARAVAGCAAGPSGLRGSRRA